MKLVIQRVNKASVKINQPCSGGEIGKGLVIMLGIAKGDIEKDVEVLVDKILTLRLFADKENKFNMSLRDINGEVLIISQFTLFADCSKGRRPFFGEAEKAVEAQVLYDSFVNQFRQRYVSGKVKTGLPALTKVFGSRRGKFGARMIVHIENSGPVTIILDSSDILKKR